MPVAPPPTTTMSQGVRRSTARPSISARFLLHYPRGFAPRTPLHAPSLAASPARSVRVAHSLRSFATSTSVVRGSSLPFGEPDVCLDLEAGVEELIAGDRQPDRRHVGNRPEAVSGLVPVE